MIRKKENRPEAADHVRSKTRNQHWTDFLRSTGFKDASRILASRRRSSFWTRRRRLVASFLTYYNEKRFTTPTGYVAARRQTSSLAVNTSSGMDGPEPQGRL